MCGLVAMLALDGGKADANAVDRMTAVIEHRGPDDSGRYLSGAIGFGFRRLSILDLSESAHQPMLCPDRRFVMVFNGEIYNYLELRRELIACGHTFESSGDTEVLLRAYIEWGPDCVEKLNGMWAFLVYDLKKRRLFGSRDRFGKKPLYYYRTRECVLFASEIKSILSSGLYQGGPNWSIASEFLLGSNLNAVSQGDHTFYSDILQVSSGTTIEVNAKGEMNQRRFWSLPEPSDEVISNPAETYYELFEDAVRLRLRSDVPVAVFLSGGLDSTSVICAVSKLQSMDGGDKLRRILALSYHADEFDESTYVDETVRQTSAELIRFEASPQNLWDGLERFLWFQDEPVHTFAALIYYELCRIASENGVKVILAGGGADEYLAGYFSYFSNYWYELLRAGRLDQTWSEISSFARAHGHRPRALFGRTLRSVVTAELKRFRSMQSVANRLQRKRLLRNSWFTPELGACLSSARSEPENQLLYSALQRSVEQAPLPLYLREDDRSSMAHGIEARSPFLDHRLVSLAFRLPSDWKLQGPWNKRLLREAMRDRIPETVRSRPDKMGFSVPRNKWFSEVLFGPMQDLIDSASFRERGIYQVNEIRRDMALHKEGKIDCADRLFNVLQFELWSNNLEG